MYLRCHIDVYTTIYIYNAKRFDMQVKTSHLPNMKEEVEKQLPHSPQKLQSQRSAKERVCTTIDMAIMNKVRALSEKEGVFINDLITLGLNMVIAKYEERHGQIRPPKSNKGNIDSIFR